MGPSSMPQTTCCSWAESVPVRGLASHVPPACVRSLLFQFSSQNTLIVITAVRSVWD
jgi:hypothetical protein